MRCIHSGRTDTDKPLQCVCYTWFVRTCILCIVTVLIGFACCLYCTFVMYSVRQQNTVCSEQIQRSAVSKKGYIELNLEKVEDTDTSKMSEAHVSKIRRKRAPGDQKTKKNKKRRGKGGKGKKIQAAHFFLKKGLPKTKANCPLGSNPSNQVIETQPILDVFELATFINVKTNPFIVMDGKFIAKKKGLYLVYAQVLFEDCKANEIMRIVQKRKIDSREVVIQEHFCFIGSPTARDKNAYNNTCSLTSLFFLEANDYLSVMNYYPEVHINYSANSTFFGAIYLR